MGQAKIRGTLEQRKATAKGRDSGIVIRHATKQEIKEILESGLINQPSAAKSASYLVCEEGGKSCNFAIVFPHLDGDVLNSTLVAMTKKGEREWFSRIGRKVHKKANEFLFNTAGLVVVYTGDEDLWGGEESENE